MHLLPEVFFLQQQYFPSICFIVYTSERTLLSKYAPWQYSSRFCVASAYLLFCLSSPIGMGMGEAADGLLHLPGMVRTRYLVCNTYRYAFTPTEAVRIHLHGMRRSERFQQVFVANTHGQTPSRSVLVHIIQREQKKQSASEDVTQDTRRRS